MIVGDDAFARVNPFRWNSRMLQCRRNDHRRQTLAIGDDAVAEPRRELVQCADRLQQRTQLGKELPQRNRDLSRRGKQFASRRQMTLLQLIDEIERGALIARSGQRSRLQQRIRYPSQRADNYDWQLFCAITHDALQSRDRLRIFYRGTTKLHDNHGRLTLLSLPSVIPTGA